ncbi:acyl-CoA dehydrogenase [Sphingomonas sp. Leaf21]|uniref:acyl-CoA dehydrogenase n=1 Tax=Sphingomonas sp. Leaf21 TaxID=2876550 RepID=UPI001E325359|nr:acyl-CoA dehydrogenase [Sphingomonas sp. Leaf21]
MIAVADRLRATIAAARWVETPPEDPYDFDGYIALLTTLYGIGREDLPVARLAEGHVDAVQIVRRHGSVEQVDRLHRLLKDGAMLGVWNAGLPGEPLVLSANRLSGGKSYASGAGVLTHALVTVDTQDGAQLLLLDLARTIPSIERDWWRVTGMQRSETHRVRWGGSPILEGDRIGPPDCYAQEPHFSGGALRFVAVHAGGVAGIFDRARDHLIDAGRADDPFQAARLAELFQSADAAAAIVRRTAKRWFEEEGEARLARVASARLAVAAIAERAIAVARKSVGLAGEFLTHPLSAAIADLTVYLRQPAPDAQRLRVGRAVAQGGLTPKL